MTAFFKQENWMAGGQRSEEIFTADSHTFKILHPMNLLAVQKTSILFME